MTELQNIQLKIAAAIKGNHFEAALPFIHSQGSLSRQKRLEIYQNSIEAALIHSLANTYEVCHALVGENFFTAIAIKYIQTNPSASPNINHYGGNFAEFIATFEPAQILPYLADVARLEWVWLQSFNGSDNPSPSSSYFEQLQSLETEKIIFHLPKNATLLASEFPIHKIWHLHYHANDESVSLDEGGVKLLVWRQESQMRMDVLNDLQWIFLTNLQLKLPLIAIYQKMQPLIDESAFFVFLQDAVKQGWLGGYSLHERSQI